MKLIAAVLFAAGVGLFIWTALNPLPGVAPPGAEYHPGFSPYKKHCARCHGLGGKSGRAAQIAREPVNLADPDWKRTTTRAALEDIIVRGKGDMKGLGSDLSPADLNNIVDFVFWLPPDTTAAGEPETQP